MKYKILLNILALLLIGFVIANIVSYRTASTVVVEIHKEYRGDFELLLNTHESINNKVDFELDKGVYILKPKFFQIQPYDSALREVSDIIIAWAKTRKYQSATFQFGPLNLHNIDVPVYFEIGQMEEISRGYPDNVDSTQLPNNLFWNR